MNTEKTDKSPASPKQLDHILKRESQHIHEQAKVNDLTEFERRRQETQKSLDQTIELLEAEQQDITQTRQRLQDILQRLNDFPENMDPSDWETVRAAKRTAEEAHLEITRLVRNRDTDQGGTANLQALPWTTLIRLGLNITWPLITTIVIATASIIITLLSLFK